MNQQQPVICFSHGQESGPWGTKIRAMADVARSLDWEVQSIDYQGMEDPAERVSKLARYCEPLEPVVLVGSSMGGHVAASVAERHGARGLFLLAPAFFMPGYEALTPQPASCPITIVHGWSDDVVPCDHSIRWGRSSSSRLILLDAGHRLTERLGEVLEIFRIFLQEMEVENA